MAANAATSRSFIDLIEHAAGTYNVNSVEMIEATVTAVDLNAQTCTVRPISGQGTPDTAYLITTVRLMADLSNGILVVPSKDSTVVVCVPKKTTPFIVLYSNVDSVFNAFGTGTTGLAVGTSANSTDTGWVAPTVTSGRSINQNAGVQINSGAQPAVLGNANVTALTDIYNVVSALQIFMTSCSTATTAVQIAAAANIMITTGLFTPAAVVQLDTDIGLTTSQNVTVD